MELFYNYKLQKKSQIKATLCCLIYILLYVVTKLTLYWDKKIIYRNFRL